VTRTEESNFALVARAANARLDIPAKVELRPQFLLAYLFIRPRCRMRVTPSYICANFRHRILPLRRRIFLLFPVIAASGITKAAGTNGIENSSACSCPLFLFPPSPAYASALHRRRFFVGEFAGRSSRRTVGQTEASCCRNRHVLIKERYKRSALAPCSKFARRTCRE